MVTLEGFLHLTTRLEPDYQFSTEVILIMIRDGKLPHQVDDDCLAVQGDQCCLPAQAPEDCGYHTWTSASVDTRVTSGGV